MKTTKYLIYRLIVIPFIENVTYIHLHSPVGWLDTALVLLAKFGISGSYAIIFLMSAELFPTSVR